MSASSNTVYQIRKCLKLSIGSILVQFLSARLQADKGLFIHPCSMFNAGQSIHGNGESEADVDC